jgi:hypothetical protein
VRTPQAGTPSQSSAFVAVAACPSRVWVLRSMVGVGSAVLSGGAVDLSASRATHGVSQGQSCAAAASGRPYLSFRVPCPAQGRWPGAEASRCVSRASLPCLRRGIFGQAQCRRGRLQGQWDSQRGRVERRTRRWVGHPRCGGSSPPPPQMLVEAGAVSVGCVLL